MGLMMLWGFGVTGAFAGACGGQTLSDGDDVVCDTDGDCGSLGGAQRCEAGFCRTSTTGQQVGGVGGAAGASVGGRGSAGRATLIGAAGRMIGMVAMGGMMMGAGGSEDAPTECTVPRTSNYDSGFLPIRFVNQTGQRLYLAPVDETGRCDSDLQYALLRDSTGTSIRQIGTDCVPSCARVEDPDNELAGAGCPPRFSCISLRLIEPGQELRDVFSLTESQYHELPGRCFVEGFSVSCFTTQQLTAGDYSAEARAYTALTCGDATCDCNSADGAGYCVGRTAPRGTGQVLTATSTFEFGGAMFLPGVTMTFTELAID